MIKKMRKVDISGPEWDIPKSNEEEIYREFGKFVVESESIRFSIIEMMTWFYFHYGMKEKSHAIQIMLNKEFLSNILDIFTNTIDYLFEINDLEKKVLKKWKKEIREISEYRNNLVHSQWATGWLSMTEKWDKAKIFSSKKRKVGKTRKEITKDEIILFRGKLEELNELIRCISSCLLTYEKPFSEYFEEINKEIIFKKEIWDSFLQDEYKSIEAEL